MCSPRAGSCVAHLLWLLCLWQQSSAPEAIAVFSHAAKSVSSAELPLEPGLLPMIDDVPLPEQGQLALTRGPERNWTAAVYLQVGNRKLWRDMAACARAVAGSRTLQHVDLYISSFEPLPAFQASVQKPPFFRQVFFQGVRNLGADLGQFLQQLQATPTLTKAAGVASDYDLILKMHTKTDANWRGSAIDDLCGSVEQVDKIVRHFQSRVNLGMLGPEGLVFRPVGQFGHTFLPREIPAMRQVWELIVDEPLVEDPMQWVMNAGSFCWARAGFFSEPKLQAALPKLIEIMPAGYQTGSCCLPPHGFERVLGTWMAWRGYSVLPVRNHPHQALISTYRHLIDTED